MSYIILLVQFHKATGVSSSRTELFVRYEGVSFTNRFFSSLMVVFCINRAQYGPFLLGMFVFVCKSFMLHYHFIIALLNAHDLCLLVSMTMRAMQWYYWEESFTIFFFWNNTISIRHNVKCEIRHTFHSTNVPWKIKTSLLKEKKQTKCINITN